VQAGTVFGAAYTRASSETKEAGVRSSGVGRTPLGLLLGLIAAGCVCAAAAAGEQPTYPAGTTVTVAGTSVSCVVAATSVTCLKKGGLSATITDSGGVTVSKGADVMFKRSPTSATGHHVLGPNGGWDSSDHDRQHIYCHVYVQGARILDCYKETGSYGGDKGTSGFDISDASLVVFKFPEPGEFVTVKTFAQP
jgi:hypothetical protein